MKDSRDWPGTEIASWERFAEYAADVLRGPLHPPRYLFRGQPDVEWLLVPSLLRGIPRTTSVAQVVETEKLALAEFRAQAHLHYPVHTLPESMRAPSLTDWWALMQHHGAPTRLLDWTASPLVAAYFAVEQRPDRDGVVYVVDAATAQAPFEAAFGQAAAIKDGMFMDPQAEPHIFFFSPPRKSHRLVAQQGYFSVSLSAMGHHDELISAACKTAGAPQPPGVVLRRLIMPAELKSDFLRNLRIANIAAHSLFPGLDGLGRSVSEIVRMREAWGRPQAPA